MELLIGWCLIWGLLAFIPSNIAGNKGRDRGGWWFYGFMLWPIALLHSLALSPDHKTLAARSEAGALAAGNLKCPHCAEWIKREAKVCRYCGRDVEPETVAQT